MNFKLAAKLVFSYILANKRWFILGLIISLALIFIYPKLIKPGKITIGLVGNYTVGTLPRAIQEEISFGLVQASASWEATDSGKIFIFNLNPNLSWQDGQKLKSKEIDFNLKGVEIQKPNDYQIKFILKTPFAPLPVLLSQPLFKNGFVGLGKEKVVSVKFNGRFLASLELQSKIYKFYPSEANLVTAFKLGAVKQAQGLHHNYNLNGTTKINGRTIATIFFNLQKKPFDEKIFRQSLTYALPNDFSEGERVYGPVTKDSWVPTDLIKKYPHKDASVSGKIKINLLTTKDLVEVAERVAKDWTVAGMPTTVQVSDFPPADFDAYLTYLSLPADPDQYALWHSTQTGNLSGYKSFKVDKLLEDGRQTLDQDKREEIYANFLKAITEDVPAAFLFYPKVYLISKFPPGK